MSTENQETYQHIKQVIRAISAQRLKDHSQQSTVEIVELPESDSGVYAHHLVLVLIADGGNYNMIFKSYYNQKTVKKIASKIFGNIEKENWDQQISDYMREYCNLTGGAIKHSLEKKEIVAGLSLPVMTRGFDEVFSSSPLYTINHKDTWMLKTLEGEIYCSYSLVVNDPEVLKKFSAIGPTLEEHTVNGDLEFL